MQIRQGEARDALAVLELNRQLVRLVDPDVEIDVRPERIEEIRADPHNFLWLLETEHGLVGSAFLTICLDPMHASQPYAVLENVVVDERYQNKGYGTALMLHVEEFCHQADCSKIMLQSHSSRHHAHSFFEKQGFSAANKKGFVKYHSQMRSER